MKNSGLNLKLGMRRLAAVCGIVGASLGGYAAYLKLKPIAHQRELHQQFEQLANSDLVQSEHKRLQPVDFAEIARKSGLVVENVPEGLTGEPIQHPPSVFSSGEIRIINWTSDYSVDSIELEDGQTLYPTPLPSAAWYLLAILYLAVGFMVPWGFVRAVEWVAAGFLHVPEQG